MFTYKTNAQIEAMSAAERDTYAADKRAHESLERKGEIEALKTAITEGLASGVNKAELQVLKTELAELTEKINVLKDAGFGGEDKPMTLKQEIVANKATIDKAKALKGNGGGEVEFVVKATATRSTVSGNQYALQLPDIGQLATRRITLYDLFTKIPVGPNNNGVVRYIDWDDATKVRAAAAIAEGGTFPSSTAAWATYTLPLQKVGDSIKMTEEFMYDDAMFAAELQNFVDTNIGLKVDTDLLSANGTSPNIKGMNTQIPAFTAVSSGIVGATLYDLIVKVREGITKGYGSKYSPNVVLMNITEINKMKLSKNTQNNYLLPPFVSADGSMVDGMIVLETNAMANDTMIVGDSKFARIYEEPGLRVALGYDGSDFLNDTVTLKAARRLNLLIRTVDQTGWLKVVSNIASITALA